MSQSTDKKEGSDSKSLKTGKKTSTGSNAKSSQLSFIGGGVHAPEVFKSDGWEGFKKLVSSDPDLIECKVHSLGSLFSLIHEQRKMFALQKATQYYMKLPSKNMAMMGSTQHHDTCGVAKKRPWLWILVGGTLVFFAIFMLYFFWMKKIKNLINTAAALSDGSLDSLKTLGDFQKLSNAAKYGFPFSNFQKAMSDRSGSDKHKILYVKNEKVEVKQFEDEPWQEGVTTTESDHPKVKVGNVAPTQYKFIQRKERKKNIEVNDWVMWEGPHTRYYGQVVEKNGNKFTLKPEDGTAQKTKHRNALTLIEVVTIQFSSLWNKDWGFEINGPLVKRVKPDGVAAKKGIRKGWKILKVDGQIMGNDKAEILKTIQKTKKRRRKDTKIEFRKDKDQIEEVHNWLAAMNLQQYTPAFEKHDYNAMHLIQTLDKQQVKDMLQVVNMSPGGKVQIIGSIKAHREKEEKRKEEIKKFFQGLEGVGDAAKKEYQENYTEHFTCISRMWNVDDDDLDGIIKDINCTSPTDVEAIKTKAKKDRNNKENSK